MSVLVVVVVGTYLKVVRSSSISRSGGSDGSETGSSCGYGWSRSNSRSTAVAFIPNYFSVHFFLARL